MEVIDDNPDEEQTTEVPPSCDVSETESFRSRAADQRSGRDISIVGFKERSDRLLGSPRSGGG